MQAPVISAIPSPQRYIWLDWMRVTSIFFVLIIHSTEPFYLGGEGSLVETANTAFWVSLFDSFARACVPLFIIASSFLQLPLHSSTGKFFSRRFVRILIPFIIWTIIYAFVWGEPIENFSNLLLNFNYAAGHLWFVYMLVGVYLLIPMLTPWAEKVSKKELLGYLAVCFFTTFIPFIREMYSSVDTPVIYGPSGIPNLAKYPLWGESSWNAYGVFYYISGFIGYMLLGLYVRRFVGELSWKKTFLVGVLPWLAGFAICFFGFLCRVDTSAAGVYPVEGPVGMAALWETPWFYDSTGVALMAIGWIFIFKKCNSSGGVYTALALPLSKASYGVYLCHMLILAPVSGYLREWLGTNQFGSAGVWTVPLEIIFTAVVTFSVASLFCLAIRKIPFVGKYIVG